MYTVTVSNQKLRLEGKGPGRWVVTRDLRLTALWGERWQIREGPLKDNCGCPVPDTQDQLSPRHPVA